MKYYTLQNLTKTDLINMEVALRLRVEACEDNDEKKEAAFWAKTHAKVEAVLTLKRRSK